METVNITRRLYVKTWGCQMNVYDSHKMVDVLKPLGFEMTDDPEGADMIVLNTCHIREKATEKLFSDLGRLREHQIRKRHRGEKMVLAVAGCVAQAEGDVIFARAPYVDMVIGPQSYHELPEMVAQAFSSYGSARLRRTDFHVENKFDLLPEESQPQGPAAFLSVQEGCDKFCTFCVVPYTRGGEYSRPVQSIISEARRMVEQGTRDITLLGQNVNAYHGDDIDGRPATLGVLIEQLAEIDGLDRIRYTTSHPRDVDDSLIAAHRDIPKLMPYLHLPVQSGSDTILKAMNRKHTRDDYLRIIDRFRAARPDIAFSSDFIVGFPGETDSDFADTLNLVRDVTFAAAYSFKYSPRPGTPAANMRNLVREDVKNERLTALQEILFAQQRAFNEKTVGLILPVLMDNYGKQDSQMYGRTPYNQAIHVDVDNPEINYGKIKTVMVTGYSQNSLRGQLTDEDRFKKAS